MKTKVLNESGLRVTSLGLGLAALGRPGYINLGHDEDLDRNYDVAAMEAHAHDVFDTAWISGIRYFDAARSYGLAEKFLGAWLTSRKIPPASVTIGSKWGYTYTADWQIEADNHEIKEHSLPVLRRQIEESRSFLGTYLDLYQIHSATLESGVLNNQGVLNELARLKNEGLRIGLTLSGPMQAATLRRALEIQIDGQILFDTVQATWNLLEQSAGDALAEAHQAGLGIIVKEALANGRLTPRNKEAGFTDKLVLLEETAEGLNTTVDALALAAVLAQPWAGVLLSGAANKEHLISNTAALQVNWTSTASESLAPLREAPEAYWKTRAGLAWN